jgi:hypothetical protein
MNHLFLIGINNYKSQPQLAKCINDITAFREILLEKFEFDEQQITELIDENATYDKVCNAFSGFSSLSKEDSLVIYFSGHGGLFHQEIEEGFWALFDTTSRGNALSFDDIIKKIAQINCKHIVIISDSCFSRSLLNAYVQIVGKINIEKKIRQEQKYEDLKSRYAITTGSLETYEGELEIPTSIFNSKMVQYLRESEKDFRVSELSEFLKHQFEHNNLQKPQSSFINDHNNQYGEFLFKVADDYNGSDLDFLGFRDFEALIQQIAPNLIHVITDTFTDSENKIGFEIITMYDEDARRTIYYIYLYQGINQKKTVKFVRDRFPLIFAESRDRVVLLPKEKQKNLDIRKSNIHTKFQAKSVHYIDEYISRRTIRNTRYFEDYISYTPKNFVLPVIESNNNILEGDIIRWFENKNRPILVIKGEGGIGKTTLAGFLADSFYSKDKEIRSVIFIECKRIRSELIRLFNAKRTLNLYDLYEAYTNQEANNQFKLSYYLFRVNIDSGNLLLVLDGLDELISHVQNFEVNDFLNSILEIKREFQRSKIILTCRTYFWNKSSINNELIDGITVRPFNENQVNEFFKRYFLKDERKTESCKRIAKGFKSIDDNHEFVYLPYVLDVIRTIIESNYEVLDNELDEKSEYLQLSLKKDYVIYRACSREREKLNELTIDNQVLFFIHLAVNKRGVIKTVSLKDELFFVFKKYFDSSQIESFKSHILLKIDGDKVLFKYDFFSDLFRSIFISHKIKQGFSEGLNATLLELVTENFWYNSGVLIDVIERITSYPTDLQFQILNVYEDVVSQEKKIHEKYKTLSGLFNLILRLNHKFKGNSVLTNTELINELFQKGDYIEHLSIMDIYNDEEIRFDFSNKSLRNCSFNNYRSFWQCIYNDRTAFVECNFFNLNYSKVSKSISINVNNISNPICDDDFKLFLKKNPLYQSSAEEAKQEFFKDFLRLFIRRGNVSIVVDDRVKTDFTMSISESLIHGYGKLKLKLVSLDDMLSEGKKLDMIVPYENRKNRGNKLHKITIHPQFRNDIISYVTTNTPSKIILEYYKKISNLVK